MNTATKLLEAMKANQKDWRIEQLKTVAKQHGLTWRQKGTSHCIFAWPDERHLSVPVQKPVKAVYVRKFLKMIEVK